MFIAIDDERARVEPFVRYRQLPAPEGASWPRASIRIVRPETPDVQPVEYAGKLWAAPGIPLRGEGGVWETCRSEDLAAVVNWAAFEVGLRRPKPEPPC